MYVLRLHSPAVVIPRLHVLRAAVDIVPRGYLGGVLHGGLYDLEAVAPAVHEKARGVLLRLSAAYRYDMLSALIRVHETHSPLRVDLRERVKTLPVTEREVLRLGKPLRQRAVRGQTGDDAYLPLSGVHVVHVRLHPRGDAVDVLIGRNVRHTGEVLAVVVEHEVEKRGVAQVPLRAVENKVVHEGSSVRGRPRVLLPARHLAEGVRHSVVVIYYVIANLNIHRHGRDHLDGELRHSHERLAQAQFRNRAPYLVRRSFLYDVTPHLSPPPALRCYYE